MHFPEGKKNGGRNCDGRGQEKKPRPKIKGLMEKVKLAPEKSRKFLDHVDLWLGGAPLSFSTTDSFT
jgi:hypothetical protein